ncbi:MAG: response regulator transcription factor [Nitrospinae bacterium]|nr:response regulator transcription factor [Nitrospinota bacterium]
MSKNKKISVVIIEDDKAFSYFLKVSLAHDDRMEVVGIFPSAEDGEIGLDKLRPDVLLVDLALPGISGIELILKVRERLKNTRILVVTALKDTNAAFIAFKAGADGYLVKGDDNERIADYVVDLHNGGAPMSSGIARATVLEFQRRRISQTNELTITELAVLVGLSEGHTYKEIAVSRGISWHTVNAHVKNIYDKLHATCRHEAIANASEAGIIKVAK